MTDRPDPHRLDDRANRAADDLRTRAEARPRPAFDTDGAEALPTSPASAAPSRVGPRRILGAAAVVALLVGGLAWWQTRPDDTADHADTTTVGPPRPHWIPDPPFGLDLAWANNPFEDPDITPPEVELFGPERDDIRLGVFLIHHETIGAVGGDGLDVESIQVGEHEGYLTDLSSGQRLLVDIDESRVMINGPSVPAPELVSIGAALSIEEGRVTVAPGSLPEGWRSQGSVTGTSHITGFPGPSFGELVAIHTREVDGAWAQVSVTSGDDLNVHAVGSVYEDVENLVVRNREASLTSTERRWIDVEGQEAVDMAHTLSWVERPGEVITLSTSGFSREQVLQLAERVKPVPPGEWSTLVERSSLGEPTPAGIDSVMVGSGTFRDGTEWSLQAATLPAEVEDLEVSPGPYPKLAVALSGAAFQETPGSSGSDHHYQLVQATTNPGPTMVVDRWFASGLISDEVQSVHAVIGHRSSAIDAEIVEGAGHRGWVIELDPTADERTATVFMLGEGSMTQLDISW